MERRSSYIGKDYVVIPVYSKSGIFHPKLTYLWGEDEDLLLVGSGNLTFGGYGKNIEVLEVLSSKQEPMAFHDISIFFDEFRKQKRFKISNKKLLQEFKKRAASNYNNDIDSDVRLITSVKKSILEQLKEHKFIEGAWKEALILSPFHHPEAKPVYELVKSLQIDRLLVGVPHDENCEFSFPFDVAGNWGVIIQPVIPDIPDPNRKLHAKWIELRRKSNVNS